MRRFASTIVLAYLTLAALSGDEMFAQNSNSAEAEAKMFAASAGYERFMGRWSRLLAPAYIAFRRGQKWRPRTRCGHWNWVACRNIGSDYAHK